MIKKTSLKRFQAMYIITKDWYLEYIKTPTIQRKKTNHSRQKQVTDRHLDKWHKC
jgi:hypothetical protein